VRRTRLVGAQATLWPDWRHHAFVTDRVGTAVALTPTTAATPWSNSPSATSSKGRTLPLPSGVFLANAAWALLATLAHNLLRWVAALGLGVHGLVVAKTIRRRFITLPGRFPHSARRRYCICCPAGRGPRASSPPGPPPRTPATDLTQRPLPPTPTTIPWLREACPDNHRSARDGPRGSDRPRPAANPTHTASPHATHHGNLHPSPCARRAPHALGQDRGGSRLSRAK
jgi:hypothetical protein